MRIAEPSRPSAAQCGFRLLSVAMLALPGCTLFGPAGTAPPTKSATPPPSMWARDFFPTTVGQTWTVLTLVERSATASEGVAEAIAGEAATESFTVTRKVLSIHDGTAILEEKSPSGTATVSIALQPDGSVSWGGLTVSGNWYSSSGPPLTMIPGYGPLPASSHQVFGPAPLRWQGGLMIHGAGKALASSDFQYVYATATSSLNIRFFAVPTLGIVRLDLAGMALSQVNGRNVTHTLSVREDLVDFSPRSIPGDAVLDDLSVWTTLPKVWPIVGLSEGNR